MPEEVKTLTNKDLEERAKTIKEEEKERKIETLIKKVNYIKNTREIRNKIRDILKNDIIWEVIEDIGNTKIQYPKKPNYKVAYLKNLNLQDDDLGKIVDYFLSDEIRDVYAKIDDFGGLQAELVNDKTLELGSIKKEAPLIRKTYCAKKAWKAEFISRAITGFYSKKGTPKE